MIACVEACEALTRVLAAGREAHETREDLRVLPCPDNERAAQLAAIIRGALSLEGEPGAKRVVLESRIDGFARRFVDAEGLAERADRALLTPDHVTRTRCWPLLLEAALNEPLDAVRSRLQEQLAAWEQRVEAYARAVDPQIELEPREPTSHSARSTPSPAATSSAATSRRPNTTRPSWSSGRCSARRWRPRNHWRAASLS